MVSPFVYIAGVRLAAPELAAARLDGDVVEVGEAYMPADAVETADIRAASLAPLLGASLAATHLSAAWVHGFIEEPPARHSAQRIVARRISTVIDMRLRYREVQLDAADLVRLGGAAVSSPARTLIDLVRSHDADERDAGIRAARCRPLLVRAALDWMADSQPVHDKRGAAELLRRILRDQEDVTR